MTVDFIESEAPQGSSRFVLSVLLQSQRSNFMQEQKHVTYNSVTTPIRRLPTCSSSRQQHESRRHVVEFVILEFLWIKVWRQVL